MARPQRGFASLALLVWNRWPTAFWRTVHGREVLVLLCSALLVQLVMPYRVDLPAHLIGGGALALAIAAVLPARAVARLASAVIPLVFTGVVLVVWWVEQAVFGPFDLVDVAFTLAGALVVLDGLPGVLVSAPDTRWRVARWSLALGVAALAYRYGITRRGA